MKFSELMERLRQRGVVVGVVRDGRKKEPTPWSDGSGGNNPDIFGVCDDSRTVKVGDLFVARGGTKVDGAKFVSDAIARGAVAVVGNAECGMRNAKGEGDVAFAEVGDVNLACAILAHEVAGNPTSSMKVIGITGTKGKTTVAYLLRSVLKAAGFKVGMIGTVEIDDGEKVVPAEMTTPGSVELVELFSRMKANGVTHCVMEVSSHALHQRRVAGIDFAVGIFTNLTGDHLDYHKTMEEYAAAKAILFEGLKKRAWAVVNVDDPWTHRMLRNCKAEVMPFRVGAEAPIGGWAAEIVEMDSNGMRLAVRSGFGKPETSSRNSGGIQTKMIGRHNASNQMAALAALWALGDRKFGRFVFEAEGAPGRLQRVKVNSGVIPCTVFVDYAHTHDALENVLTALRATMGNESKNSENLSRDRKGAVLETASADRPLPYGRGSDGPKLICVFGCGGDRDRTKRPKMGAVAERLADVVIVTSDNPRTENPAAILSEICAGFSAGWREARVAGGQDARVTVEADRRIAIRKAIGMAAAGDVVLIAGKGHENYQIIGTVKHHFDDVEEAENALRALNINHDDTTTRRIKT